jgi:GTP-binding protein
MGAADMLKCLPPIAVYEPEYVESIPDTCAPEDLKIRHCDDVWILEGPWLEKLVRNVNFSDYESRMFFDRMLRNSGVYDRLEELGINEGDTVSIFDLEFEYAR